MKEIEIRKVRWPQAIASSSPDDRIVLYLVTDSWDDFGFRTLFHVHVVDGSSVSNPGDTKILFAESEDAEVSSDTDMNIKPSCSSLSQASYASLGQSLDYYKWFVAHPDGTRLLHALADMCVAEYDTARWQRYKAFGKSLVRFSDAQKALEEAPALLAGKRKDRADLSFTYSTTMAGAEGPHVVSFHFDPDSTPPRRVNAIIGPNGVGKSTLLHQLAKDLSQSSLFIPFFPKPPSRRFSRQILVSMSPFDISRRPAIGDLSSYRFVGLRWRFEKLRRAAEKRDPNQAWLNWLAAEVPSPKVLMDLLSAEFEPNDLHMQMLQSSKQNWSSILGGILDKETFDELIKYPMQTLPKLSAGQQSIIGILAGLSAEMDEESLVLIDEPESHLHPRFLSQFFNGLVGLLQQRNSFAIVATHSTLIVQGIPADAVHVVLRDGRTPRVRKLGLQSFGATLPALAYDVFHVDDQNAYWSDTLEALLESKPSVNEILSLFSPPLEPEVEVFLRSRREER